MPRKRGNQRSEAMKRRWADCSPNVTVSDKVLPTHSKKTLTDGVDPLPYQKVHEVLCPPKINTNSDIQNSGIQNSGIQNSGIQNSGIQNSGIQNSGIQNFGNFGNSGINNFDNFGNSGINNFGNFGNSGINNFDNFGNSGINNSG
ncbi:hypothetical protein SKAU_G00234070, partial [Synaphobranchus kaupii]